MTEQIFQKKQKIKKTIASNECKICHYWYFKDISLKYEPHLYNRCHGLMQKAVNFKILMVLLLFMLKEVLTKSLLVCEQR